MVGRRVIVLRRWLRLELADCSDFLTPCARALTACTPGTPARSTAKIKPRSASSRPPANSAQTVACGPVTIMATTGKLTTLRNRSLPSLALFLLACLLASLLPCLLACLLYSLRLSISSNERLCFYSSRWLQQPPYRLRFERLPAVRPALVLRVLTETWHATGRWHCHCVQEYARIQAQGLLAWLFLLQQERHSKEPRSRTLST